MRSFCYAYNTSVNQTTSKTPFELVLTRPPPEFLLKHEPGRKAQAPTREEYVDRLKIALGKAKASLFTSQERYKKTFDRRVRHARKLKIDDKVYLDIEEGGINRGKLSHGVAGAFRIVKVENSTNTVIIQRGDVVERVAMNRVVRAPCSATVDETNAELQATSKDLEDKVKEGKMGHEAHLGLSRSRRRHT